MSQPPPASAETGQTFVWALGIGISHVDGRTHGEVDLVPAMWIPGTQIPRLGLLATFVDMVGGQPPHGIVNPTVDLRTTLLRPAPATGTVHLVGNPLKVGRRFYVAEVLLDDSDGLFARSSITFLNEPMDFEGHGPRRQDKPGALPFASFDDLFAPRYPDERTIEIDTTPAIVNGPGGTVQGGVQATLVEMASEWVLRPEGAYTATDLEIRYLNRVKGGPVAATAEVVAHSGDDVHVRVLLTDRGAGDRIVAYGTTVCRPITS